MESDWTTARADYESKIRDLQEVQAKLHRHIDWLHEELRKAKIVDPHWCDGECPEDCPRGL